MRGTQFAEMSAFAAIAELKSFAKAATLLGIGRSTLSQNLRSLEERLGVRLLNRTTRSVSLTEAGARLLARVRPALEELTAAADEAVDHRGIPSGLLRLVVQPPVATFMIAPMLARFMRAYRAFSSTSPSSRCRATSSRKISTLASASASNSSAT